MVYISLVGFFFSYLNHKEKSKSNFFCYVYQTADKVKHGVHITRGFFFFIFEPQRKIKIKFFLLCVSER